MTQDSPVHAPRPYMIAVVGAGIVGCSTALTLAGQGHSVTVIAPDPPGSGATFGNAGAIVDGSVTPVATPGVLRALPSYMLDRDAPAILRLNHLPRALPWLLRFVRSGFPAEVDRISAALAPLVTHALDAYQPLLRLSACEDAISQDGWLKIYASEAEFAATALERELLTRAEIMFEVLDREALTYLEPNLAPELCLRGIFQPSCGFVRDPAQLARQFLETTRGMGGKFRQQSVSELRPRADHRIDVTTESGTDVYDKVVVAAGAWSEKFVRQCGDKVRLDSERGYHIAFSPDSTSLMNRPVAFPGMGMVLSPMSGGLRMLNGTELAGLTAAPDFRRIRNLTGNAHKALPALRAAKPVGEWMGHRPSTPDTLPVIGRSPRCANVHYAFGHGHLGLTLAAKTAEMIAAEIRTGTSRAEYLPYLIDRFGRALGKLETPSTRSPDGGRFRLSAE